MLNLNFVTTGTIGFPTSVAPKSLGYPFKHSFDLYSSRANSVFIEVAHDLNCSMECY